MAEDGENTPYLKGLVAGHWMREEVEENGWGSPVECLKHQLAIYNEQLRHARLRGDSAHVDFQGCIGGEQGNPGEDD